MAPGAHRDIEEVREAVTALMALLIAMSRHMTLRSLQCSVRRSPQAVAALTAQHDPARRRRGDLPKR